MFDLLENREQIRTRKSAAMSTGLGTGNRAEPAAEALFKVQGTSANSWKHCRLSFFASLRGAFPRIAVYRNDASAFNNGGVIPRLWRIGNTDEDAGIRPLDNWPDYRDGLSEDRGVLRQVFHCSPDQLGPEQIRAY